MHFDLKKARSSLNMISVFIKTNSLHLIGIPKNARLQKGSRLRFNYIYIYIYFPAKDKIYWPSNGEQNKVAIHIKKNRV